MNVSIPTFCLALIPTLFVAGVLCAQEKEAPPRRDPPRVALLPFATPEGYEPLGGDLARAIRQDLKNQVDLVEVKESTLTEPLETCILHTACVDGVLKAAGAEALLFGQVHLSQDSELPEPKVLIAVVAPTWRLSYAERWAQPSTAAAPLAARSLFAIMQGRERPQAGREQVAQKPPESGSTENRAAAGDEGFLEDEDVDMLDVGPRAERKSKRKARREDRRLERAARRGELKPGSNEKASVAWPTRDPDGGWKGWNIELMGGLANGAIGVEGVSQITSAEYQYRWALRTNQQGWDVQAALYRALGSKLEYGIEAETMPSQGTLVLYYQPSGEPAYDATHNTFGMHVYAGGSLHWLPLTTGRFQPYLGIGAGLWFSPGFKGIDQDVAGPHYDFGPYYRLGLKAGIGLRVLISKRFYAGLNLSGLIDPGAPFLEPVVDHATQADDGLDLNQLISPPTPKRAVGKFRLGVGLLW